MKPLKTILKKKTAVFAFGRMNPPTAGHEKLIKKVLEVAKKSSATPFLFVSHTQDAKKNPLTSKQKVKYIKLGIPAIAKNVVYDPNIKTPFQALKHIEELGYTDVIMIAGADRVAEFNKTIGSYVNHPDPSKSFNLDSFKVVSAGDRDPDAEGVTGISGSKMREFVTKNDFASFKKGVPSNLSDKYAKEMFDAIKKSMNVMEMFEEVKRITNSLNIPRNKMPQIKKDNIPEFIKTLKRSGVDIQNREISVKSLKPTQNEINMNKVKEKYDKLSDGGSIKPFIVSYDNYILDGHHQLFALKTLDSDMKVSCFVISVSMKDLLKHARAFPKTTYKTIAD
jgi:hypothetical protein